MLFVPIVHVHHCGLSVSRVSPAELPVNLVGDVVYFRLIVVLDFTHDYPFGFIIRRPLRDYDFKAIFLLFGACFSVWIKADQGKFGALELSFELSVYNLSIINRQYDNIDKVAVLSGKVSNYSLEILVVFISNKE